MLKQQQANHPLWKKNKPSRLSGPIFQEVSSPPAHILLLIAIVLGSFLLVHFLLG